MVRRGAGTKAAFCNAHLVRTGLTTHEGPHPIGVAVSPHHLKVRGAYGDPESLENPPARAEKAGPGGWRIPGARSYWHPGRSALSSNPDGGRDPSGGYLVSELANLPLQGSPWSFFLLRGPGVTGVRRTS